MKPFSGIIINLLFLSIITSCTTNTREDDDRGYIVKPGDQCPDITLRLINDSLVRITNLKGRVVMLQFTASWCKVCREEMPYIEKDIWQQFRDKGLVVIGIDRDEPLEKVRQFARDMKITYPLALDPGAEIFGKFAVKESGVTRNVIIDKEGKITILTRLFNLDEFNAMKAGINELLKEKQ